MHRSARLTLLLCCGLAAALRFRGLFANTFHADEALFAGWARLIAVWRDPLLLTQTVDKPPLLFYLQALFYPFFGPVEWAARMPSFIASLVLVPLTAQMARRMTGDRTAAVLAAALLAVAPLAVQFSATAFSDALLACWLIAALYVISQPVADRSGAFLAGLLFGLALATKYQALLFAPLFLILGVLHGRRRDEWLRAVGGAAVVLALLLLWQAARPAAGDLLALQWANIGGLRPARSWELWARLLAMHSLWRVSLGWPLALAAVVGGLALLLRRTRWCAPAAEGWLALFVAGYLALHWLWAVPVWDRYLVPVLPLVAILLGRMGASLWRWTESASRQAERWRYVALVLLVIAQMPVAAAAREGRFPIGGQPAADGGAAVVAGLLKDVPYGTVLYDHWYSWHWRYQLFDGQVYVSWFPDAEALLADLHVFAASGTPRHIALPSSEIARPVIRRLTSEGYRLERVAGQERPLAMTLYRIEKEETSE